MKAGLTMKKHPEPDGSSSLLRVLKVLQHSHTNSGLSRLLLRSRMTSADVIFRCATLVYLSSSRGFWRASLSGLRRKEFAETKIWRDWFQQNHDWRSWEEQIITTLTSFDHRYSYSQNVSVDRTMRWRAWNSDEFAPDFPPLRADWTGALSDTGRQVERNGGSLSWLTLTGHNPLLSPTHGERGSARPLKCSGESSWTCKYWG